MVTLFSKNNCQPCRLSKMALDRNGVSYRERRIDEDPEALAEVKSLGYLQAPVVLTAEGEHWSGFRPDKINSLA